MSRMQKNRKTGKLTIAPSGALRIINMKTRVLFKKSTVKDFEGVVIAFFPDAEANQNMILSYEHIGQHGEASIEFFRECISASPQEYAELKNELENLCGYNLEILSNKL